MSARLTAILLLFLAGCSGGADEPGDAVELLYATPYSPGHPFGRADVAWMEHVEAASGGDIRIRANWSGGVLSSEHSMVEIRRGVADIGLITPIYVKGGAHLIRVQSGFYSGVETIENQVALFRCLRSRAPQIDRELEGLKILAVQGGSLPWVITRNQPVESLEDLDGLRIRAPVELLPALRQLGADPVNMSMSEVYSALAKGVLDGVVAPADTFRSLHFMDVADHATEMHIPRGAYPARAMNMDVWRELSAEHQDILEDSISVWEEALAREIEAELLAGIEMAEEGGVSFHTVPAADQERFDALYLQDAQDKAAQLAELGIDGLEAFRIARASIGESGQVDCKEGE